MFETKTTIRRRAIRKAMDESNAKGREAGREEGRQESAERIRAMILARGIELSPEDEKEIFGNNGHRS